MAYSDYGAFVYKNGERRRDKEDVALFKSDEETFGESSENIPSGARIWTFLFKLQHDRQLGKLPWIDYIHHGIMGDGDIRVMCHKQGLPQIYERTEEGIKEIKFAPDDTDHYDYPPINFEYKGYKFKFISGYVFGFPYVAEMTEPDGTHWKCEYDYMYGAGFESEA